jgi:hypothetical protein
LEIPRIKGEDTKAQSWSSSRVPREGAKERQYLALLSFLSIISFLHRIQEKITEIMEKRKEVVNDPDFYKLKRK